jgi:hypothetical protein
MIEQCEGETLTALRTHLSQSMLSLAAKQVLLKDVFVLAGDLRSEDLFHIVCVTTHSAVRESPDGMLNCVWP